MTLTDGLKVDLEDFREMTVTSKSRPLVKALRTKVPRLAVGPVLVEA